MSFRAWILPIVLLAPTAYAQSHGTDSDENGNLSGLNPNDVFFDPADIPTLPVKEVFSGFRSQEVSFMFQGKPCKIHFFMKADYDTSLPPTLMIHGFSDTGNSYTGLVRKMGKAGCTTKNVIWVDWPHHGRSQCGDAKTFKQSSEATAEAFKILRKQRGLKEPGIIMGHSMGTTMSSILAKDYPNTKLVWLAPPIMNKEAMKQLARDTAKVETAADGKKWIDQTGHDPTPRLPFHKLPGISLVQGSMHWVGYKTMVRRVKRARSVIQDFLDHEDTIAELAQDMTAIPKENVTVITGGDDALTHWDNAYPDIHRKFDDQATKLEGCPHNVHRDCPDKVLSVLREKKVLPGC